MVRTNLPYAGRSGRRLGLLELMHVRVLFREGRLSRKVAPMSPCHCRDSMAYRHLPGGGEALTPPSIFAVSKEIVKYEN